MGPTEPVSTTISHILLFSATAGATGAKSSVASSP